MNNAKELPSLARALAVILLVMGGLGLLSLPCGGAVFFLDQFADTPNVRVIREDSALFAWTLVHMTLGGLLTLLQIIGAAALLKRLPWSRPVLLGQSIAVIVLTGIGLFLELFVVTPRVMALLERLPKNGAQAGVIGGTIGGTIGSLFALVLPILTVIAMTRPETREALEPRPDADAYRYPPSL